MAVETKKKSYSLAGGITPEVLTVIDTDVHHSTREKSDLIPYLPKAYRDRYADIELPGGSDHHGSIHGRSNLRVDTWDEGDPLPASSRIEKIQAQLLDECGVDIAILTGGTVYPASALSDVKYGSALCRAFNDYTIDHWLSQESRLRYCLAINSQDPQAAAAEIDRLGNHPGICAVVMNTGAPRPYGQPFYRPIHEACANHGLAIALHFAMEGGGINGPPTAAGFPSYYIESRLARPSFYSVHLANFIFEGVFEKFPTLKVALLEGGFSWAPGLMWKMDADWKALRHQTPLVKRRPSEYVRDHIRFATQPVEEPDADEDLATVVEWMHGERTLMFSSDYPHWDFDHPSQAFTKLRPGIRRRIMSENARETFRL